MYSNPVITGFISTGQVIIPIGTRQFSINVVSGSALVNNTLYLAGQTLTMNMPDSKTVLGTSIAVGMTGGLASANKTTVFYTT